MNAAADGALAAKPFSVVKSRELLERSDGIIIDACQSHKRNHTMLERGYPTFVSKASGARFQDVDGNEYLDYLMGFGPILLGYNDPAVSEAIRRQMEIGTIYSTAHFKELEVAEKLLKLIPWADMLGYFIGGSAATSGAIRLARAYTNREKIIRCGYHGWHDWTQPGGAGVPKAISELTLETKYNDLDRLDDLFKENDNQVACVIMETVQHKGPQEGFLQGCIDIAHKHGALCIFDEIKVGFRMAFGGACEYYGVTPDMATFGKACCNGFPASFVVGKKDILSHESCRKTWLGATFHCDLPSLVALDTVIDEMKRRDGIAYQWKLGDRLVEGINAACEEGGLSYRLVGPSVLPKPVKSKDDADRVLAMLRGCLARGFYLHPGHVMFLSLSHTQEDIENTIDAVKESIAEAS